MSSFHNKEETKEENEGFSFDPNMIMSLMGILNSPENNKNADLIRSIKPYLSDKRKSRADSALKLLKLLSILPKLKDSGLLSSLF
ncbi:MAG: hypothetical protein J6K88_02340 [Oscillospiraceae bacterium]|nr:hypothetical protein [Oscillospiraceae bacterium]